MRQDDISMRLELVAAESVCDSRYVRSTLGNQRSDLPLTGSQVDGGLSHNLSGQTQPTCAWDVRPIERVPQGGFTLVEIAIVVVVVGLLLAGILKGQELIIQARIKDV